MLILFFSYYSETKLTKYFYQNFMSFCEKKYFWRTTKCWRLGISKHIIKTSNTIWKWKKTAASDNKFYRAVSIFLVICYKPPKFATLVNGFLNVLINQNRIVFLCRIGVAIVKNKQLWKKLSVYYELIVLISKIKSSVSNLDK